ncbi:MAG: tetratricopeptide repeat protein, partial [Candidatus Sulfotelmatobacter sp.]
VVVCLCAPAAEKSPWLEIRSTHFTVITDAGEKKGREVALRFEQMRSVFAGLLSKEKLYQPLPATILAFKNDKSYYQVAPLKNGQPTDAPGFFLPGEDQDFFVLNVFEEESWRAVAHDLAHMLLNANYPAAQGWFDEGLAEYFSSIRVDNKQVEIGSDPELHASVTTDALQQQHDTHPPQSLTELLGAQVWLSMADLFTMTHDTASYNEGTHNTLYYAQSWITMHYLLHEKKLPETGTYFNLVLNQHIPVEEAIQQAYGMTSAQLEQAVKDYFHAQTVLFTALDGARQENPNPELAANPAQVYQFPVPVGPEDAAIIAKPFPEADAQALYAEVEIRIPERREYGMKELQKLAEDASATPAAPEKLSDDDSEKKIVVAAIGNEVAHRALAWDHIERGEFEEASAELGKAAAINPRDMWLRYYVSVLKYRIAEAKHAEIQGLANMMQDLRGVLEWYPEFADAYDLMAVARMEGGGATAALQAERAALQLNPRQPRYVYHMAQIYIANKQWEAAKTLLERLKASGDQEIAALAREKVDQIATERKYGIPVASGAAAPKLAPQKSPFDVLDQDAAERAKAENSASPGITADGTPDKRPTKFLRGELVSVDCTPAPSAILTVTSQGSVLKLRAPDYKSLVLVGSDEFSCDWHDRRVAVNYKPGGAADGDVVSLEVR